MRGRTLSQIPAQSHTAAGKKPRLHSRRLRWAMRCRRWWLGPRPPAVPSAHSAALPTPSPLGVRLNVCGVSYPWHHPWASSGWLAGTVPITLWSLPVPAKSKKRRDETPQHPHPSSELAPCHFSPAFGKGKWSKKGWVVGENTMTCDFFWTILLFVVGELCWFGCKPTAKANPTVCIAFGLEGASLFSSPVCCTNLPVSVVRAVSPHLCSNANIAAAVVTLHLFCCSNFINCKPVHCLTMSYRNGFVYK